MPKNEYDSYDLNEFVPVNCAPILFDSIQLHFQEHYEAFLKLRSQLQDRDLLTESINKSLDSEISSDNLEELEYEENTYFSPEEIESGIVT